MRREGGKSQRAEKRKMRIERRTKGEKRGKRRRKEDKFKEQRERDGSKGEMKKGWIREERGEKGG